MSKRVVSLLLTLLLALSVCIPAFASTVEPADQPDVSESAEEVETAPEAETEEETLAEEEPAEEGPVEETPTEGGPSEEESAEEGPEEEPIEESTEETENETSEISESPVSPIADDATDYYVVWDGDSKTLTFQTDKPGEPLIGGEDYWSGSNSHLFEAGYSSGWHQYKTKVEKVLFTNTSEIVLNGAVFNGFTNLKTVEFNNSGEVSFGSSASEMFHKCESLTTLDLSKVSTENTTAMYGMFQHCSSLTELNLSGWHTSSVTRMNDMFSGCHSLKTLNLSGWDTSKVTHFGGMFANCDSLKQLTVGNGFKYSDSATVPKDTTGYWVLDNARTQPMLKNDGFLQYFAEGNKAGTYIFGNRVLYNPNEGSLIEGEVPPQVHRNHQGYTHDQLELADGKEYYKKEKEVFVGWTEKHAVPTITSKEEENKANLKKGTFKPHSGDNHLYAAWAVDANENDTPDYDEELVTITFDINGGDGSKETAPYNKTYTVSDELSGTSLIMPVYPALKWQKSWEKDGSLATHPALLVGWSKSPIDDIILENDRDSDGAGLSKELIERYEAKVPDTNTTYYAVYAADENGDEMADCFEYSLQVEYYANGGTRTDGRWVDKDKGIFFRCDHHHVPFEDGVVLMDLNQGKEYVVREGAVLLGWSENVVEDLVKTADAEAAAGIVTKVTMPAKGNKKVYAVWAEDRNKNGIADYEEDKVTITFDINGGDGSGDQNHTDTFTLAGQVPGAPLVIDDYGTLKWTKAWNKDGRPASHPAILAGWSSERISNIILENDRDENGENLSDRLVNRTNAKVPGSDTTYYAVYAADENDDGIPDYRANSVQVEYYANGGTRTDGRWVDKEKGIFYRCSHHHVPNEDGVVLMDLDQGKEYVEREGATLIGWSENVVKDLVTSKAGEEAAGIVTVVTMPSEGNKKVYAVWAVDENNNKTPDYMEQKIAITFNIGGGHGTGTDAEHSTTFTVNLLPGTYFDLPSYAQLHWSEVWEKDGGIADFEAILAGWSEHPINDVILEDDINDQAEVHEHLSDQIIRQPHIKVPTSATTYYAVYAADENNDGEPDYLSYAEQVEYYANGGKMVKGSWIEGIEGLFYRCGHHHVAGEEVTLLRTERGKEMITRTGAVLLGWSEKANGLITTKEGEDVLITTYIMPDTDSNGSVYAVWAIDENGNGIADYKETTTPEEPEPKPTPSTKPTPTPTPKPDYGIIPDVPWYQYQPEDEGEYVPGPDEVTNSGFPDVDPNAWYAGPVGWAAQSGVTAGYPDGNFHPDDTCTRAQIVTFLWKAAGTPMSVGTVSFSDVEQGSFYYDAAVWAANSGIIAGYPDGNFHPDDPCTRAQIVAMLYRYANSPAVSGESKFFDVDAGAYYYNAAIWAEQNGIVAGYPDGGFHPDDACTRAQIVTMLYNYIKG